MRARPNFVLPLIVCSFAFSVAALAQKPAGGGGAGSPSAPPPRNTVPNIPMNNPGNQIYMYNGKVTVLGPPLTDSAKVIAKCNASKSAAGGVFSTYTDLKGSFSLTLGRAESNVMDASVDPSDPSLMLGRATTQLTSCEVTVMASGYIPSQITVQFRSSLDVAEMGKLVLQPIGGGADLGGIVSVTTLSAPEHAQHEYAKGIQDLRDKKFEKAEKHFQKATVEYPKFAVAWEKLGQMQIDGADRVTARASFQKAIDADPKFVPPYLHLALLSAEEAKWDSVLELTNKAISVDQQHFPEAYFLNGAANFNLGNASAAEKSATRADELDKQHSYPRIQLLLAEIFNRSGRREAAADHFRRFLQLAPDSQEAGAVKSKLAKLEVPASK